VGSLKFFVPRPASRVPRPASRIPHPASRIPHPALGRPDLPSLRRLSFAVEHQRRLGDDVRRERGGHGAVLLERELDRPLRGLDL